MEEQADDAAHCWEAVSYANLHSAIATDCLYNEEEGWVREVLMYNKPLFNFCLTRVAHQEFRENT